MAYKSQVTNKYYGGTSAGSVASAKSTELSQVIDVLKNEFNPAIGKLVDAKIDEKKDTAKAKVQEMYSSGKSVDVINQEILDGKHPDLRGAYVDKTVSYHTGRFKAAETIAKIEANKDNYNFKESTLDDFYKPYLPEFKNADGSFALGFGAVFNEYKANQAIKDGANRAQWKHDTKMEKGVSLLDTVTDIDNNYWATVSSLGTKLPKDETGKFQYYFDADEQNEVAIKHANSILDRATKPEDIDKALKILTSDRGTGKGGNQLGSLLSTNKKEVLDLVSKLNDKRVRLTQVNRYETEWKETQEKKTIIQDMFTPNSDGTDKSFKQKLEIVEKLKTYGDITLYNSAYSIITKDISQVESDPDVLQNFLVNTATGKYENLTDMVKAYNQARLPEASLKTAITYWNTWKTDSDKGNKPIWSTDITYTGGMTSVLDAVAEPFKDNLGKIMKGGDTAQYRARNYMITAITEAEAKFREENGRAPTTPERQKIMESIGDYLIKTFGKRDKNVELLSMTEVERIELEKEQNRIKIAEKYQKAGVDVVLNNLNTSLQNTKNIPKLPKMETSWFKLDSTDRKNYVANTVIPTVQNYLTQSFGVQLTPAMWEALTNEDAQNIYTNVANAFKIDPEIVRVVIGNILNGR